MSGWTVNHFAAFHLAVLWSSLDVAFGHLCAFRGPSFSACQALFRCSGGECGDERRKSQDAHAGEQIWLDRRFGTFFKPHSGCFGSCRTGGVFCAVPSSVSPPVCIHMYSQKGDDSVRVVPVLEWFLCSRALEQRTQHSKILLPMTSALAASRGFSTENPGLFGLP